VVIIFFLILILLQNAIKSVYAVQQDTQCVSCWTAYILQDDTWTLQYQAIKSLTQNTHFFVPITAVTTEPDFQLGASNKSIEYN
jgi:hypothetical protein